MRSGLACGQNADAGVCAEAYTITGFGPGAGVHRRPANVLINVERGMSENLL